jgi:hypothetical protein
MAFHYSDNTVFWTYHNNKPGDLDPDEQELISWDKELFEKFDEALVERMNDAGIPVNKTNKSMVLSLAKVSNGSTVGLQVRNACTFFVKVKMSGNEG